MRQESSFLTADVQDGHINELTCFYKCLLPGALHREGSVTESELSPGEGQSGGVLPPSHGVQCLGRGSGRGACCGRRALGLTPQPLGSGVTAL